MLFLLLAALAAAACFLPLTLRAEVYRHASTRWTLRADCAGLHRTWRFGAVSGGTQLQPSRVKLLLDSLRRADRARRFLLRHTRLSALDALLLLRTGDAAHSALLAGTLSGVARLPTAWRRSVRIRVLPEFFRAHSTIQARCIIRLRLGTIILTAMMLLAATLRQRHLQKARQAYGTSHW